MPARGGAAKPKKRQRLTYASGLCSCGDCLSCEVQRLARRRAIRRAEQRSGLLIAEVRRRAVDIALERALRLVPISSSDDEEA